MVKGMRAKNKSLEENRYRLVLVEGLAKTSAAPASELTSNRRQYLTGRTDGNKRVVFELSDNSILCSSVDDYLTFNGTISPSLPQPSSVMDPSLSSGKHGDVSMAVEIFQTTLRQRRSIDTHKNKFQDVGQWQDLRARYVVVKVLRASGPTLRGAPVAMSSVVDFAKHDKTMNPKN